MRIGLLLGSFNPITCSHVNMASSVLNEGLVDKVLFVVAKQNPWKSGTIDMDIRVDMANSAIAPLGDRCEVCDIERDIEPPTYSYKTILALKERYREDELFFILGTDLMDAIHSFKGFKENILPYVSFIEIERYSYNPSSNVEKGCTITTKTTEGVGEHLLVRSAPISVSSTLVRNMVSDGKNPYPFVSEGVLKIINDKKLYRNE